MGERRERAVFAGNKVWNDGLKEGEEPKTDKEREYELRAAQTELEAKRRKVQSEAEELRAQREAGSTAEQKPESEDDSDVILYRKPEEGEENQPGA